MNEMNVYLSNGCIFVRKENIQPTCIFPFLDPQKFVKQFGLDVFQITFKEQDEAKRIPSGKFSTIKTVQKDNAEYILKMINLDSKQNKETQLMFLASEMIFLAHFKNNIGNNMVVNIVAADFDYKSSERSFLLL